MTVVHGELDTIVPKVHASITAALVPQAEVRLIPGLGHMSITPPMMVALGDMAAKVWGARVQVRS